MFGLYTSRTTVAAFIGMAACATSAAAMAGESAGFVPQFDTALYMIYVSRAIGVPGPAANTFGLRYERATPGSSDPVARFCAPLRHTSLIDLQLTHGLSPRMLFGPKVTWDLGRHQLAPTSLATRVWPMATQPLTGATLAAWVP